MLESNVKIGVTEISPRAVQQAAELNFKNGYYCCEALMATIKQEFKLDVPDSVIAMASGMAVGAGKSGCVCGAFNGGILALGMFFGRTEQNGPTNPKSVKCMELTHELHDWLKQPIRKMRSAVVCSQKNSIWDRANTKSSVSSSPAYVHGRLLKSSVASAVSRILMRLISHASAVLLQILSRHTHFKASNYLLEMRKNYE